MDSERIGKFIKELRLKNNLTQQEFASEFGVTYQAVSKWETGKNIPDLMILNQICKKYKIDINELLDGNAKKTKTKKLWFALLVFLITGILCLFLLLTKKEENFEFKALSSNCNNFKITGSIAYNQKKSSVYISHITYCGKKDENSYKQISCSLYEVNGKEKVKIDDCNYKSKKETSLEEFLKNIQFKVDDYSKTCKSYSKNSLELEIDAVGENRETTTYKIPLNLEKNCPTK